MVVGWGVIGCGTVATNRTIPEGIVAGSNARLVAVTDILSERAEAISAQYNVRTHATNVELLRDPEVDAVYVAVPPFAHAEIALSAAEHGKPTLLEKPIARNATEGEAIVTAFRTAGVPLGIGFMMRYHACHVRLNELIESGAIGELTAIRGRYSVWYPPSPRRHQTAWMVVPERAGGGPLMDVGSHALDLMTQIAGSVNRLVCLSDSRVHGFAVEDTCTIMLQFMTGVHGILQAYNCTPNYVGRNALEVHGTQGTLVAESTFTQLPTGTLWYFPKGAENGQVESQGKVVNVQPVNTYQSEVERFATSLLRGEPYPIQGEDGLYNQQLIDAAYQSARDGKFVSVEQFAHLRTPNSNRSSSSSVT